MVPLILIQLLIVPMLVPLLVMGDGHYSFFKEELKNKVEEELKKKREAENVTNKHVTFSDIKMGLSNRNGIEVSETLRELIKEQPNLFNKSNGKFRVGETPVNKVIDVLENNSR